MDSDKQEQFRTDIARLAVDMGLSAGYLLRLAKNADKCYKIYSIRKSDGRRRLIEAPNRTLKGVQSWILQHILYELRPHAHAHGFVKRRSIRTNAEAHTGRRYVLCMDIKDFFPSIAREEVVPVFAASAKYSNLAGILSQLCLRSDRLPQGGVTSPALSNMVFKSRDEEITKICETRGVAYTRYADDLTFSSDNRQSLIEVEKAVDRILDGNPFAVQKRKSRLMHSGRRQAVTGIVVNGERVCIGRKRKRELRAAVHKIATSKDTQESFEQVVGMLSFLRGIEPDSYRRFMEYADRLARRYQMPTAAGEVPGDSG